MQIYLPAINSWNTEEKNNLLSGQSTWPSCQGGEKSGKAFLPNKALLNARPIVLRSGQARERGKVQEKQLARSRHSSPQFTDSWTQD